MRHQLFAIKSKSSLFRSLFFLLLCAVQTTSLKAQDDLTVIQKWIHFSDASNSLYHHLAGQAFGMLDKRTASIARLNSLPEWQKRQQQIRTTLLDIVGPFPARTPLNARVVNEVVKDGYKVQNIIYESQPGFFVTSALFIPDGIKEGSKAPAIIYCSGHSLDGYRNPVYQHVILNLVKKGFVVFGFDPVGQGERLEYDDFQTWKSVADVEHSYPGVQAFINGASQAGYMTWDGIRAVDYLLTRKEVDGKRIGLTGRSGGGTQTAYIGAMDDRIKALAPENYITNFTRLIQTVGPQDGEQDLFNGIAHGIDMADFLLVQAPKPILMITTTRDMFSIQGARETAKEVSRIYKAYGKQENFRMTTDDAPHASTKKNRESMYAFFQKSLNNPGDSSDAEVNILTPKELQVTETGQVSTSLKGETVFSLNRKAAERLVYKLQSSRKNFTEHTNNVLASAKKLSGYQQPKLASEPVFTGRFQKDGYVIEKYFIKGGDDYVIPYLLMKPANSNHKALLYLHPSGKAKEASPGGEIEWFVKKGFTVLAPDLLGTGEMGPGEFRGDSYIGEVSYNISFLSTLIGKSIVGIQAGDAVKLVNLLKKETDIQEIYGLAHNEMSAVLLHAAAFDPDIKRVALIEPYASYRSILMTRLYNPAFVFSTVPGSMQAYDLPDLAATIAPRKLLMFGVTDGAGNKDDENIREDLRVITDGYKKQKADSQLNIAPATLSTTIRDIYEDWIK
ncbi:MAG: alpha/beta hydrolase family protein [Ginsengibacter sp.]